MALIPSESYSFPEHFLETVGRARKASRQPSDELPEPETPPISTAAQAVETEKQQQSVRSRWWQFVGFRESPKVESVVPEPEIAPTVAPEMETPPVEPETIMAAASGWIEPEIRMEPANDQMPIWAESFQEPEPVVEIPPAPPASEPEAEPIMSEMPIPMNISTELPPPLQMEEQPVIDQPAGAHLVEPEKTNGTGDETSTPRIFIPSLVPSTLKRKVRWNRAAQAQENHSQSANVADFHGNVAPFESYLDGPLPTPMIQSPPVVPPPAKPNPELRPKISVVPPFAEPEMQVPPPVAPENKLPENNPSPEESGCRTVEAPSADLVQTLLARALFASNGPDQAAPSTPLQNHVINFTPAPPPPQATGKGNLPPPSPQRKSLPVVEQTMPAAAAAAVPESLNEGVLTGRRLRTAKLRRFIIFEAIALGVLVPLALLGLLRVIRDPTMILIVDIVTISAAIAATLTPILFFAVAPPLPRGED